MSITITTLNNEAAVAKTFTLIGRDRAVGEWIDSTDDLASFHQRLFIKQSIAGKQNGVDLRRSLVQSQVSAIDVTTGLIETVNFNCTLLAPTVLQNISLTAVKDSVAFSRNLLTASVVAQLLNGEL